MRGGVLRYLDGRRSASAAFEGDNLSHVLNELGRFAPRELIMNKGAAETKTIPDFAQKKLGCLLEMGGDDYEYMACAARVCEQFGLSSIDEAGLGDAPAAVSAAGALLRYISETQKTDMAHIRRIDLFTGGRYMELDWSTAPLAGADGIAAHGRKARLAPVGAGQDENADGRTRAARVDRAAAS